MFQPASPLTFDSAKAALDAGLRAIADGQMTIDLGGVTAVDSAAVATLIVWQRAARSKDTTLAFLNVSDNLSSLLELYGVADLLHAGS
jgi:phospholipid transport system transporter-binding protein